jgi:hypothetical protein
MAIQRESFKFANGLNKSFVKKLRNKNVKNFKLCEPYGCQTGAIINVVRTMSEHYAKD